MAAPGPSRWCRCSPSKRTASPASRIQSTPSARRGPAVPVGAGSGSLDGGSRPLGGRGVHQLVDDDRGGVEGVAVRHLEGRDGGDEPGDGGQRTRLDRPHRARLLAEDEGRACRGDRRGRDVRAVRVDVGEDDDGGTQFGVGQWWAAEALWGKLPVAAALGDLVVRWLEVSEELLRAGLDRQRFGERLDDERVRIEADRLVSDVGEPGSERARWSASSCRRRMRHGRRPCARRWGSATSMEKQLPAPRVNEVERRCATSASQCAIRRRCGADQLSSRCPGSAVAVTLARRQSPPQHSHWSRCASCAAALTMRCNSAGSAAEAGTWPAVGTRARSQLRRPAQVSGHRWSRLAPATHVAACCRCTSRRRRRKCRAASDAWSHASRNSSERRRTCRATAVGIRSGAGRVAAQLPPSAVFTEALAAGAITVCSTGTDQATPPTIPAFFRKSRRDEAGRTTSGEADISACRSRGRRSLGSALGPAIEPTAHEEPPEDR